MPVCRHITCMGRIPTSPTSAGTLLLRRLAYLLPASIITILGCRLAWEMSANAHGAHHNILVIIEFFIFSALFAMLSFTSWAALMGLAVWLAGRRLVPLEKEALAIPIKQLTPSTSTRTAILVPAYHEDATEVFARVSTMREALAALQPSGSKSDIDIFILSDSQQPAAIKAEAEAYRACIATLSGHGPSIFYRRRTDNAEYKVGNIKEFCTRWGNAYEHMLILDADSLMSGETIRRMIILMERHQRIGLLQTCFIPIGRDTLFCRVMQFSARLYLMPAAMGLEFWQGANANYWGHNAIVRTRAFMENCGLPALPGKAPLGGRILSHDIVEAAFIARGGWEAWLLPNMPGTFEELPTNLIDFMQRDRRWCAGNLQHQHIIRADEVPFGNRMHMGLGIMSYVTGPLWLAFIMLSIVGSLISGTQEGLKLATAGLLSTTDAGTHLLQITLVLLFLPKLLTLGLAMALPQTRKSFGGGFKLLASALLEQLFNMLQQPAVMLFYTTFVVMPLCGNIVKWEAQPRSERGINWKEAFLRHQYHMAFAVFLVILLAGTDHPATMLGLAPVLVGLILSPAFTVLTSRASLGQLTRKWGLFLTTDELAPAAEIKNFQKLVAQGPAGITGKVRLPALPAPVHGIMDPQPLRYPRQPAPLSYPHLGLEEVILPVTDRWLQTDKVS